MHISALLSFGMLVLACASAMTLAQAEQLVSDAAPPQPGLVQADFIYHEAPFAQCHASTIEQSGKGLVAAWFGGTAEGHPDVGIWVSRREGTKWSAPVEVAHGVQYVDAGGKAARHPCWNPVLFQPREGPLMLFYKCGPSPRQWWGMLTTSADGGATWSLPLRLPEGIYGPIKNKPIQLNDGTLLCPTSGEATGWLVHFERTADLGRTWQRIGPVEGGKEFAAIQPALLTHADGRIQALCRSRQRRIVQCWSPDGGITWSRLTATDLPNPNAGIDAVSLRDGRHLLVYNHTAMGRSPLNLAVSEDGQSWRAALVLEGQPGEYSYPAVIQAEDGMVHCTYTWRRRRIKHVVIDPVKLEMRELPSSPDLPEKRPSQE